MKRTTRKLSGPAKDRFLDRFFRTEPGLDAKLAERLTARSKAAFTSLRVRRDALAAGARSRAAAATSPIQTERTGSVVASATLPSAPVVAAPPTTRDGGSLAHGAAAGPIDGSADAKTAAFDPYCVGLVPVFQREGREGLIAKLESITAADHLRQMAKVQKIVLPQDLRAGDHDSGDHDSGEHDSGNHDSGNHVAAALRIAIADAVARRIADRRAAAG